MYPNLSGPAPALSAGHGGARPLEPVAEMTQRPSRPGLDRSDRPAQRGRDLGLGESTVVGEIDHPALHRVQGAERVVDRCSGLLAVRTPSRDRALARPPRWAGRRPRAIRWWRHRSRRCRRTTRRRRRDGVACPPEVIDGAVVGDRHQPGAEWAARRVKELGSVPQCPGVCWTTSAATHRSRLGRVASAKTAGPCRS